MGSDESHFNVSVIAAERVTRQCPQTTTFEENGEPKRIRTELLPLGIPAFSPLNIKHKYNVHTVHHFSVRPHHPAWVYVGNNRDNFTQSYLHVVLLSDNYKAFY